MKKHATRNNSLKILDINFHTEINAHLFYALPLCIILNDKNLLPWYYENFIDIGMSTYEDGRLLDLDFSGAFLDHWSIYDEVLHKKPIQYEYMTKRFDMIDFIVENINQDIYLTICVNFYFLPPLKNYYKKVPQRLECLVYGYDKKSLELQIITLDSDKGLVKVPVKFGDFRKAFNWWRNIYLTQWEGGYVDHFFERRNFSEEYPFSLCRFTHKINNYLNSKIDDHQKFYMQSRENRFRLRYLYGISLYDALVAREQDIITEKCFFTYQLFHTLYEHKKAIYTRLNYVGTKYGISEKFHTRTKQYLEVVEKSDAIRLAIMKHNLTKNNPQAIYDHIIDPPLLTTIMRQLKEIKNREHVLLNHILEELTNFNANLQTV